MVALQDVKSSATYYLEPYTFYCADRVGFAVHDDAGVHGFTYIDKDTASLSIEIDGNKVVFFSIYMPQTSTQVDREITLDKLQTECNRCGTQYYVIGGDFNEGWTEFSNVENWANSGELPSRPGQGASAPSRLNTWVIASLPERVKKNTVVVLFGRAQRPLIQYSRCTVWYE